MIRHVWSVLCRATSVDEETNILSLFNVLEQVNAGAAAQPPKASLLPIDFQLVTYWTREDIDQASKAEARYALFGPDGAELGRHEATLDLLEKPNRRVRINFPGLPISGNGRYWFKVFINQGDEDKWELVSEVPVTVNIEVIGAESQPQANSTAAAH